MPPKVKTQKPAKRNVPKKKGNAVSESSYDAMAYARCLITPFNAPPCHIPDPDVSPSGAVSSHYTYTTANAAFSGTATSHSFGVLLYPYPSFSVNFLQELTAGSGTLSDLNAAGTTRSAASNAPNLASFGLTGYRIRCSGAAVRIIYEGTELNRAGRIFGGNLPIAFPASSVASTGTQLSALSAVVNTTSATTTLLRQSLADVWEIRNPSDKVTEIAWKPSSVPHYQTYAGTPVTTTTAGAAVPTSVFSAPAGAAGAEAGQNALLLVVDGDVTPSASTLSNVYTIEVVWHWEVVPDDIQAVAYDLSPSHSHSAALDMAFNAMARAPTGRSLAGAAANYDSVGVRSGPVTAGFGSGFQSGRPNRQ